MIELAFHTKLSRDGNFKLNIEGSVESGEFIALYGPSGSGKTSLLRLICGLLPSGKGSYLKVNGKVWVDTDSGIFLRPQERNIGMVFQDYALFPSMTVLGNLKYAAGNKLDPDFLKSVIRIFDLKEMLDREPHTLSGGQKQRVAVARALARKPEILLLDEPMAAVDMEMRSKLQGYLLQVHQDLGLSTFMVSHEPSEIIRMADRIWVMDDGSLVKKGTSQEVFGVGAISGKFRVSGEILDIFSQDVIFLATVRTNDGIVKVVVDEREAKYLNVGDKVLMVSKAFNPIVKKIG